MWHRLLQLEKNILSRHLSIETTVAETGVISGLRAGERVALFNADGKLEMEQLVSGSQHIINVKKLPSGVYMAQIIRNGTAVTIIKVVKK